MTQQEWDKRFIELAFVISKWSKDPNTKVGAVIVSSDNRLTSTGYNGFSEGLEESDQMWKRPIKYEYVIHAEVNALLNIRGRDAKDCTIYLTTHPCHKCLSNLVNAGIRRVVWKAPSEEWRNRWITPYKEIFDKYRELILMEEIE